MAVGLAVRRRNRSAAVSPPHSPSCSGVAIAYSKQASRTGHAAHTCFACISRATRSVAGSLIRPQPRSGPKNSSGSRARQAAWRIHPGSSLIIWSIRGGIAFVTNASPYLIWSSFPHPFTAVRHAFGSSGGTSSTPGRRQAQPSVWGSGASNRPKVAFGMTRWGTGPQPCPAERSQLDGAFHLWLHVPTLMDHQFTRRPRALQHPPRPGLLVTHGHSNQCFYLPTSEGSKIPRTRTIHKPLNNKNKIEWAPVILIRAGGGAYQPPVLRAL